MSIFKTRPHEKIGQSRINVKDQSSGYGTNIIIKSVILPDGILEKFFVTDDKDSVQIFAVTHMNEVILVRQWRPGNESEGLELPGGGLEKDEDPLEAAERELLEETMFSAGRMEYLGSCPYSPYSNGRRHMFFARDCVRTEKHLDLDDNEHLQVLKMPLDMFVQKITESPASIRGWDLALLSLNKFGY